MLEDKFDLLFYLLLYQQHVSGVAARVEITILSDSPFALSQEVFFRDALLENDKIK